MRSPLIFAEIYGASVSKETISRITDKVIKKMQDGAARPLDEVYTAISSMRSSSKTETVRSQTCRSASDRSASLDGHRGMLGLWDGLRR